MPPPSCFPGFTRGWPDDWSKQALRKKKESGWLKLLAGFTRKKASTRRVNKKIADSTRNQRVVFSRYLAANYGFFLRVRLLSACVLLCVLCLASLVRVCNKTSKHKSGTEFSRTLTRCASSAYVGNTRSEEENTILYSDLAYKWNILEPINGISWKYDIIIHLGLPQEYAYSYSPRRIQCFCTTKNEPHVGAD